MKRERSTEYEIQQLTSHGWEVTEPVYVEDGPKRNLARLQSWRDGHPLVEFRLVKKSTVTTTTVVNGAET